MKSKYLLHILVVLSAIFSVVFLVATYGTALPSAPFASIELQSPSIADSDGERSAVVDTESRRVLIMNETGELTGVIDCTTIDSPVESVTDVCVSHDSIYIAGVTYVPDSDWVDKERVAVYDKGGNFKGTIFECKNGNYGIPSIKSLSDAPDGVIIALDRTFDEENTSETTADASTSASADAASATSASASARASSADGTSASSSSASASSADDASSSSSTSSESARSASAESSSDESADESSTSKISTQSTVSFLYVNVDTVETLNSAQVEFGSTYTASYSYQDGRYAILSIRGLLDDSDLSAPRSFPDHVLTAIDLDDKSRLYACDDTSGSLCLIDESGSMETFLEGKGFQSVHANNDTVSVCTGDGHTVIFCNADGTVTHSLSSVTPSIGFSIRMMTVWLCALYLITLAVVLAVRKTRRAIAEKHTENIGPMLASVAVIAAISVAIGSLSYSSYQTSLDKRADEINMCADYLDTRALFLSQEMETVNDRNLLRTSGDALETNVSNLTKVISQPQYLVLSASQNNIGMYFALYGKDDKGVFYLYDSSLDHVFGTSALSATDNSELANAFGTMSYEKTKLLRGSSRRDATQYRYVRIPTSDGDGVAGVIEIGSKTRSFESSIRASMAQRVLALLVMVLVVYLAYSELRACSQCLFSYRELQKRRARDAVAVLTRPFTFGITMLQGIDSVMTVLIARELLVSANMGSSSPLLALPAVMLGLGLIIGQMLYGQLGSRVGLRRLMVGGVLVMMLCACFTIAAVVSGNFWLYCVAKLALSVPFGMLYTLGYSLPRLAESDDTRAAAAGGVKRTDTSAAALGTVLGGYAAQVLGNAWVYVLVAITCLPLMLMALNLLPRHAAPPETEKASTDSRKNLMNFVKSPQALAIAAFIVLPATLAAGYTSFLFPLFSADLGLTKANINNIFVLGQLIVYVSISSIDALEARHGKWRVATIAISLLGVVFLLFSLNTTLVWSIGVIAIVGVLGKSSDGWKALWLHTAKQADVPAGRATGAMFATRSLTLVAQPFILGALLGVADSVAVIIIGVICILCAGLFYLATRHSSLPAMK